MKNYQIHWWKKAPATRILFPFIAGILFQWYIPVSIPWPGLICLLSTLLIGFGFFRNSFRLYRLLFITGLISFLLLFCCGSLVTLRQDIRNSKKWFGNKLDSSLAFIAIIDETPVEKAKSFKANARICYLQDRNRMITVTGKIILYFDKNRIIDELKFGSAILFKKIPQPIRNTGNPASFDFARYSFFQGITHQVFLDSGDFRFVNAGKFSRLKRIVHGLRNNVLSTLRKYLPDEKELGLAEALLIGYKDDLDKTLVQSYSNTGVVHVIAISGLHLGLIYGLLLFLLKPLKFIPWLKGLLILSGLWLFTFIAGAQPSVLRSAVMFSCLVIAESSSRKGNIINTLAVSAFILLCINPYWLWDTGFQLSYSAVLSIILYMKPIYGIVYFKNKIPDNIWKLNAVTLSAQILTLPFTIYYFHQFPNYFLITNIIAVPLSSLILFAEILLCAFCALPYPASLIAIVTAFMIRVMNLVIEKVEKLPFSVLRPLQIDIMQAVLLTMFLITVMHAIQEKKRSWVTLSFLLLATFCVLRSVSFYQCSRQQKIIVYNIPGKQAIDLIKGRYFVFIGDSSLKDPDNDATRFNMSPSRIRSRVLMGEDLKGILQRNNAVLFNQSRILVIDKSIGGTAKVSDKLNIDLLIISKNPRINFKQLRELMKINTVVFDGTNSKWKLNSWKAACDSLGIRYHDVATSGAFVMNIE